MTKSITLPTGWTGAGGGGGGGAVDSVDGRTGAVTLGDLYQPVGSYVPSAGGTMTDTLTVDTPTTALVLRSAAAVASLGSNKLTNPDFDTDLSGWTAGAGWAWDAGTAKHTAGNTAALSQDFTDALGVHGYVVTVTITGRTAGSVTLDLGATTAAITATTTVQVVSAATSPKTFRITPTTDFDGAVTSVVVAPVTGGVSPLYLDTPTGTTEAGAIRAISSNILAVGNGSGQYNTTGSANTAVGYRALALNAIGGSNTAVGYAALNATVASQNTGVGTSALQNNVSGAGNTALGYRALRQCLSGASNTAVGGSAASLVTTGAGNTAVGFGALVNVTTGNYNAAFGNSALNAQTGGGPNTAVGERAYATLTTGVHNTAVGDRAGDYAGGLVANATTTASRQTLLGHQTGQPSATQADDIVAVGYQALAGGGAGAVALGSGASASAAYALAVGKGVTATAAGSVAIGVSSTGTAATATATNTIVLGTTSHTVSVPGPATVGTTLAVGATPASAGTVKLPNNAFISWRNVANTADDGQISYSSGDDLQLRSANNTTVYSAGNPIIDIKADGITLRDAMNLATNTTTGTKIAATSSQKLGFWGATPVARPTSTPAAATDPTTTQDLVNFLRSTLLTIGLIG